MLVTDDPAIAARARMMSLHGISKDAWSRYDRSGSWYYEVIEAGYKYNMTDIAAAIGHVQLERSAELHAERRRLAAQFIERFTHSPIADLVQLPLDGDGHAWHLFVIRLHLDRMTIDRAGVIDALRDRGIGASVHFIPLHRHPYYADRFGLTDAQFPIAAREYPRVVSLPLWPGMLDRDIDRVVAALETILTDRRAKGRPSSA